VTSLSLHGAWRATDPFLRAAVEGWRIMVKDLGRVTEIVIAGVFPWCLIPELSAAKPDYADSLAEFVRGRPMPPLDAFLRQSETLLNHDAADQLGNIVAPTQIAFGRHDAVTSTRFAELLQNGTKGSELVVFVEGQLRARRQTGVGAGWPRLAFHGAQE